MSKSGSLSSEQFTWDIGVSGGLPLLLQDGQASFIYGPGGMLIEQVNPASDDPVRYYHPDQLGSIRAMTNSAGSVVNTYNYDAYGQRTSTTGTAYNPFGYTGEYTDQESGLIYLRARYYDPSTQQFLTVDPLVGWTEQAYAYVGGSPTNFVDPSGECPWCIVGAIAGAIVGSGTYLATCGNNCNWGAGLLATGGWALVGGTLGLVGTAAVGALAGEAVGGVLVAEAAGGGIGAGVALTTSAGAAAPVIAAAAAGGGGSSTAYVVAITVATVATTALIDGYNKICTTLASSRYTGDNRSADEIISRDKRGSIRTRFPKEWLDKRPDQIYDAAKKGKKSAQTAKKLLDGREYDK